MKLAWSGVNLSEARVKCRLCFFVNGSTLLTTHLNFIFIKHILHKILLKYIYLLLKSIFIIIIFLILLVQFSCIQKTYIYRYIINKMPKAFLEDAGCTCNGKIFIYPGTQPYLYVFIALAGLFALYLLYKTVRLCNIAFSYSNFHVHQTYKLYILALINVGFIILSRAFQLDYMHLYFDSIDPEKPKIDLKILGRGYQLVNDLFGIFSIFTNNFMHIYNSFTWVNIAFSCDYNINKDSRIAVNQNQLAQLAELSQKQQSFYREKSERRRKIIKICKNIINYFLTSTMLVVSVLGTLFYSQTITSLAQMNNLGNQVQNSGWCDAVTASMIISTFLPLGLFGIAFFFYAKRFWDPQIAKVTKVGLVYLLLVMLVRFIFFVITAINSKSINTSQQPSGDILSLVYTLFFTLVPIVVMSILGQKQLQKQQYTLLRRSSLIFNSTIL